VIEMRKRERLDYAVFDKLNQKKIISGKGDIAEELAFLARKFNVEDDVLDKIGRKGAWYD